MTQQTDSNGQVQRHEVIDVTDPSGYQRTGMEPNPSGHWVRYDDYRTLEQQLEQERERAEAQAQAIQEHNAKMDAVPSMSGAPQNASDGLRFMAKWFDGFYRDAGTGQDTVQQDLRKWADEWDQVTKERDDAVQSAEQNTLAYMARIDDMWRIAADRDHYTQERDEAVEGRDSLGRSIMKACAGTGCLNAYELRQKHDRLQQQVEAMRHVVEEAQYLVGEDEPDAIGRIVERLKEQVNDYNDALHQGKPIGNKCVRYGIMDYPTAARSIAINLSDFCDRSLGFPEMVADAARTARARLDELEQQVEAMRGVCEAARIFRRRRQEFMNAGLKMKERVSVALQQAGEHLIHSLDRLDALPSPQEQQGRDEVLSQTNQGYAKLRDKQGESVQGGDVSPDPVVFTVEDNGACGMTFGVQQIAKERGRQMSAEGWTAEHDDTHEELQLARNAMAMLAEYSGDQAHLVETHDEWGLAHKHKDNPDRLLEITGALVAAERDRRERMKRQQPQSVQAGEKREVPCKSCSGTGVDPRSEPLGRIAEQAASEGEKAGVRYWTYKDRRAGRGVWWSEDGESCWVTGPAGWRDAKSNFSVADNEASDLMEEITEQEARRILGWENPNELKQEDTDTPAISESGGAVKQEKPTPSESINSSQTDREVINKPTPPEGPFIHGEREYKLRYNEPVVPSRWEADNCIVLRGDGPDPTPTEGFGLGDYAHKRGFKRWVLSPVEPFPTEDEPTHEDIRSMIELATEHAASTQARELESLIDAWMRRTGKGPDEAELVQQQTPTGITWSIRYKEPTPTPSPELYEAAKPFAAYLQAQPVVELRKGPDHDLVPRVYAYNGSVGLTYKDFYRLAQALNNAPTPEPSSKTEGEIRAEVLEAVREKVVDIKRDEPATAAYGGGYHAACNEVLYFLHHLADAAEKGGE